MAQERLDVVERLVAALEPEDVVLGGGNVKKLKELPPGCRAGDNANAFLGGFRLWKQRASQVQPTPLVAGRASAAIHNRRTSMASNQLLTRRPAWKALQAHHGKVQGLISAQPVR